MATQVHAFRLGRSLVLVVPREVRTSLQLRAGGSAYWHLGSPFEAVLARSAHRTGGRPAGAALAREHEKALQEIERLRAQLRDRPLAVLHEGKAAGWAEASKYYLKIAGDLAAIMERVKSIDARLPFARRRGPRAQPRAHRAPPSSHAEAERDPPFADDFDGEGRVIPRPVEEIPLPDLPSTSESDRGGADTSGAEPPGVPRDDEGGIDRARFDSIEGP